MDTNYVYAIIVVAITGLISLFSILITKIFDERKLSKELIIKTALEHWKASIEISKYNTDKTGQTSTIDPLEDFVIHAILFSKLFNKKDIKEKYVVKIMKDINETQKYIDDQRKKMVTGNVVNQ